MKRVCSGVSLRFVTAEDGHVKCEHHGLEASVAVADNVGVGDFGGTAANDHGEQLGYFGDPQGDTDATLQTAGEV